MPDDPILLCDVLYKYFIIYHNVIKIEMKCMTAPRPTIPQSMEKLSSVKPVPRARKFGNCCLIPYTVRLTNRKCHVSPNPLRDV